MPYIKPRLRRKYDKTLEELIAEIKIDATVDGRHTIDGQVNYVITKILLAIYSPESYYNYNRAIGVLECAKLEFYRRKIAPYEDMKKLINGDVYNG